MPSMLIKKRLQQQARETQVTNNLRRTWDKIFEWGVLLLGRSLPVFFLISFQLSVTLQFSSDLDDVSRRFLNLLGCLKPICLRQKYL
jgi:hypothetical protein